MCEKRAGVRDREAGPDCELKAGAGGIWGHQDRWVLLPHPTRVRGGRQVHPRAAVGTHRPGEDGRDEDKDPGTDWEKRVTVSEPESRAAAEEVPGAPTVMVCELPPPTHLGCQINQNAATKQVEQISGQSAEGTPSQVCLRHRGCLGTRECNGGQRNAPQDRTSCGEPVWAVDN